jgi:hypothetical protein
MSFLIPHYAKKLHFSILLRYTYKYHFQLRTPQSKARKVAVTTRLKRHGNASDIVLPLLAFQRTIMLGHTIKRTPTIVPGRLKCSVIGCNLQHQNNLPHNSSSRLSTTKVCCVLSFQLSRRSSQGLSLHLGVTIWVMRVNARGESKRQEVRGMSRVMWKALRPQLLLQDAWYSSY